jgi:hypothetical protein
MSFFAPNWGRFKTITSPVTGNHEYHTANAQGYFDYFDYFGSQAPAPYAARGHATDQGGQRRVASR